MGQRELAERVNLMSTELRGLDGSHRPMIKLKKKKIALYADVF